MSYSRYHNLQTDMQTWWRHKFRRFRQSFDDRPYLANHFWCHFTLLWILIFLELVKVLRKVKGFLSSFSCTFISENKNFHFISTLVEFVFRTVKYQDQGILKISQVIRTELVRSVHKDWGLNILQHKKQTQLINSLLYATENLLKIVRIYREFS